MKLFGAKFFSIVIWLSILLLAAGLAASSWVIYSDYKGAAQDAVAQHKRVIVNLAAADEGETPSSAEATKQEHSQGGETGAAIPSEEKPAAEQAAAGTTGNPAHTTPPAPTTEQAQGGASGEPATTVTASAGAGGASGGVAGAGGAVAAAPQPEKENQKKEEPSPATPKPEQPVTSGSAGAGAGGVAGTGTAGASGLAGAGGAPAAEPAAKPTAPAAETNAKAAQAGTGGNSGAGGKAGKEAAGAEIKQVKIAIIMTGMGLSKSSTVEAMKLPSTIAFSFSPYSASLNEWFQLAKANGNEILMDVPMEPSDYPITDPGPYALLTSLSKEENITRLKSLLSLAGESLTGLVASRDEKFSSSIDNMAAILPEIKAHDLRLYFASRNSSSPVFAFSNSFDVPVFASDVILDEKITESAIKEKLADLEKVAQNKGWALAVAKPYPLTVKELTQWNATLAAKGIKLVPVSEIGNKSAPANTGPKKEGQ